SLHDADPEASDTSVDDGPRTRDRIEQERTILRTPRNRPDRVERWRDRDDTAIRDKPRRRSQAGRTAETGRDADRAPGIGSERACREVCRSGGSTAAARAATDALEHPRIVGGAEVG